MIEFEGFELQNNEDGVINRQLSTQPFILKQFMKALGAKEGSTSWDTKSFLTPEQQKLHKSTLKGYKDLEYEGPGEYQSGTKADDLEGFKAKSLDELRSLQDEGNLSIAGLDKLRSMRADASTRVNPDIDALRGLGKDAWAGYDAQLAETTRAAREKLRLDDIAARRRGMSGGTALARLGSRNVLQYGRTVGDAAAMAVEKTAMQRQQLAQSAYGRAMQGNLAVEQLGLQGLQSAGSLQAQQNQMALQDLSQRRGIVAGERQFGARHELDTAQFSEQQAQAKNLWSQTNAAKRNQFMLAKLRDQNTAATTQTFKNIKNVKRGSAGLGGAVLTAGGAVLGGYFGGTKGAEFGAQFGNALIPQEYGGGGGDAMSQAVMSGVNAYGNMNRGQGQVPPSMQGMGNRPQTDYAWYEDDPLQGPFDTWGQTPAQTQLNLGERQLKQQNWDTRLFNRQQWVNQQLSPTPASNSRPFNYNQFFMRGQGYGQY